jgi:hypothetical protein
VIGALLVGVTLAQYVRTTEKNDADKCLWWNERSTIVWAQSVDGNPETTGETEFTAMESAFSTWQAQLDLCGSLTFTQAPRTSLRTTGYVQGQVNQNVVLFRSKACAAAVPANDACWEDDDCGSVYDCWQFATAAIAMTTTSYDPATARILDADIELNAKSFIFTTVDEPICVAPVYSQSCVATDVQNTATHEIGHLLGLGHIATVAGSTMAARADPGETSKRVLDPGTRQFVCDVYPQGQPAKTCTIVQVDPVLTPVARGCSSVPGALFTLLALVGLARRRR